MSAEQGIKAAQNLPGKTVAPQEIAEEAAKYSEALNTEIIDESNKAAANLTDEAKIPLERVLSQFEQVKERLLSKRLNIGTAQKRALQMLNRWTRALTPEQAPATPLTGAYGEVLGTQIAPQNLGKTSETFLRKAIKTIDDDAGWEGVAGTPVEGVLRQVRKGLDTILKASNSAYREAMEPIAAKVAKHEAFNKALGFQFGPLGSVLPTDRTITALTSIVKGSKAFSKEAVEETGFAGTKKLAASELAGEAKDLAIKTAQQLGEKAVKTAEKAVPEDVMSSHLRQLAESAARQGKGSPAAEALEEFLIKQGADNPKQLAEQLITAGAKELYQRGRGTGLTAAASETVQSLAGDLPLRLDKLFGGAKIIAKGISKSSRGAVPLTKVLAGD